MPAAKKRTTPFGTKKCRSQLEKLEVEEYIQIEQQSLNFGTQQTTRCYYSK